MSAPRSVHPSSVAAEVSSTLASVAAEERLRIVASLIATTGDWDLAEDCFHDAVARALTTWPERGIPNNAGAWLTTVAKNRAVDLLRKGTAEAEAAGRAAREANTGPPTREDRVVIDNIRLRLVEGFGLFGEIGASPESSNHSAPSDSRLVKLTVDDDGACWRQRQRTISAGVEVPRRHARKVTCRRLVGAACRRSDCLTLRRQSHFRTLRRVRRESRADGDVGRMHDVDLRESRT